MTFTAAGKRTWSPKGRPKSHARDNGYSHTEGGVATSYPAFCAFMGRVNSWLRVSLLFAASLTVANVSVAQVTAAGTVVRNTGTVAYELPGGLPRTASSNEVQLAVQPLPSRATLQLARYEASSQVGSTAGPTQCRAGNAFVALGAPAPQGVGTLDPLTSIPMQWSEYPIGTPGNADRRLSIALRLAWSGGVG